MAALALKGDGDIRCNIDITMIDVIDPAVKCVGRVSASRYRDIGHSVEAIRPVEVAGCEGSENPSSVIACFAPEAVAIARSRALDSVTTACVSLPVKVAESLSGGSSVSFGSSEEPPPPHPWVKSNSAMIDSC